MKHLKNNGKSQWFKNTFRRKPLIVILKMAKIDARLNGFKLLTFLCKKSVFDKLSVRSRKIY